MTYEDEWLEKERFYLRESIIWQQVGVGAGLKSRVIVDEVQVCNTASSQSLQPCLSHCGDKSRNKTEKGKNIVKVK